MRADTKKLLMLVGAITVLAFLSIYAVYSNEGFQSGADGSNFYMVYADWCPHCQVAKPMMTQLRSTIGQKLKGKNVSIELLDGESKSPLLAQLPEVKGFPTFFLKKGSNVTEYKGPRDEASILQFLSSSA